MDIRKSTLLCFFAFFLSVPLSLTAQPLCENQIVGSVPYYEGWSSCYGSGYWGGDTQYGWIDQWVGFTLDQSVWLDEWVSSPYPGGWLSCQAWVPYAGEWPIYDEVCQKISSFTYNFDGDTSSSSLYGSENSSILDSMNLDDSFVFNVSWTNPGSYSVRVEYKIDYVSDGTTLTDIGWTYLLTMGEGSSGGILPLNQRYDFPNFPSHSGWVTSDKHTNFSDPYRNAIVYYRFRLESSSQNAAWQYMKPIWVYMRD